MSDDGAPFGPLSSGHWATTRLPDAWYILAASAELTDAPVRRRLHGLPIVLFRDEHGRAAALVDRCAHRNVPLSAGRRVGGELECSYHGWRFGRDGVCRHVPALVAAVHEGKARRVPSFASREQQGYVWVWGRPDAEPTSEPFVFPHVGERRYALVRYSRTLATSVYGAAENALDVPHTAFLHRGLFRGGKPNRIKARVRRSPTGVEAEYVGEPVPTGLLARVLAPRGGTVRHFDRFLLPSIVQVEYALGDDSHLVLTNALTPESDFEVRMFAMGVLRLPFGAWLASRLLLPLARHVVAQDAEILAQQTETTRLFGGEQFVSTDVDVLGPQILRLLRQAERGEVVTPSEHEVELQA